MKQIKAANNWLENLIWNESGLIPAIAQDAQTGEVLMMAWMNQEALQLSAQTGFAHYWSRSRNRLWKKGESSSHEQKIIEIFTDCDCDVLLLRIEQIGGIACHTGRKSCFYRQLKQNNWLSVSPVIKSPEKIYQKK